APRLGLPKFGKKSSLKVGARKPSAYPARMRAPVPGTAYDTEPAGLTAVPNSSLPSTDRKSTRLNSSHRTISYAVFCLKKKMQSQFLYGPISALTEEPHEGGRHTLLEALRKLFRLEE